MCNVTACPVALTLSTQKKTNLPLSRGITVSGQDVDVRRAVADGRLLGLALTPALVPVRVLALVRRATLDPLRRPHGLHTDGTDPVGRAHWASGMAMPISSAALRAASVASSICR